MGKYKTEKSCLNIKNLEDVQFDLSREILQESLQNMAKMHPVK